MSNDAHSHQLHATAIAVAQKAVLLMGASGSGKSDLALRLIDAGASLVADDQVIITRCDNDLRVSPAPALKGILEMRGVGLVQLPHLEDIILALVVMLTPREEVERMPEPAFFDCLGLQVPLLSLHAFDCSTPAKIRLSLQGL